MKSSRIFRLAPLFVVAALGVAACGSDAAGPADSAGTTTGGTTGGSEAPAVDVHVVASTTWTGALAKLAGATDIDVIAPTTVLHPPDYDPKPSDLVAAADADIVVYAEFESFAKRLVEAAGGDTKVFPLTLENTATSIESEVMRLAKEIGTEDIARKNLDEFLPKAAALGEDAATNIGATPPVVVSQVFMNYWADWAGLTSAGTFGPKPMSAGDLAGLMDLKPTLIFDNYHVPGGQAFEAEGTPRIELINYPGDDLDLLAVFQHNHDLVVKALKGEVVADPNVSVPAGGHGQGHGHGDSTETTAGGHGHGESTETTAGGHGHGESTETTSG